MLLSRGYKCSKINSVMVLSLLLCSLFLINLAEAKNLDHHQQEQQQHNNNNKNDQTSCESVKYFFDSLNVTIQSKTESNGSICGGHCCNNATEDELVTKSTNNFERLLRHHTRSLRGILESTANTFREHVLELSHQSENKTLNLFSQVYRRMSPFSRQPILELYESIRSHISSKYNSDNLNLETVVKNFFMNLFPVAYHHVIHAESNVTTGDFHIDYKNCLMHTFDDIQPFGDVPKIVAKSLLQSVGTASVFLRSLDRGAVVLASTEELDSEYLTPKCKMHLLKISYCPECNGLTKSKVKSCFGYCLNVMRGCLTQYVGSLDSPWTSFAESIEKLLHIVRSKEGIETIVRTLDVKLSEAIMHAMQNGPELEKKVKKSCGAPSLLPSEKYPSSVARHPPPVQNKWVSPPDTEMLHFLVTIDKSKEFYSKIVTSLCDDDEFEHADRNCWTGDKIGEYTQTVMPTGTGSQKYNPEVPYESHPYRANTKINELVDKLINLRQNVANSIQQHSSHSDSDNMQSDMAEGSGGFTDDINDDSDLYGGEGSGSGDGRGYISRTGSAPRAPTIYISSTSSPVSDGNLNRISITILSVSIVLNTIFTLTRRH